LVSDTFCGAHKERGRGVLVSASHGAGLATHHRRRRRKGPTPGDHIAAYRHRLRKQIDQHPDRDGAVRREWVEGHVEGSAAGAHEKQDREQHQCRRPFPHPLTKVMILAAKDLACSWPSKLLDETKGRNCILRWHRIAIICSKVILRKIDRALRGCKKRHHSTNSSDRRRSTTAPRGRPTPRGSRAGAGPAPCTACAFVHACRSRRSRLGPASRRRRVPRTKSAPTPRTSATRPRRAGLASGTPQHRAMRGQSAYIVTASLWCTSLQQTPVAASRSGSNAREDWPSPVCAHDDGGVD
jgi:hypothetical protein